MVHVYTCSSYSEFLISMDTTDLASTSVSKGICESVLEITLILLHRYLSIDYQKYKYIIYY